MLTSIQIQGKSRLAVIKNILVLLKYCHLKALTYCSLPWVTFTDSYEWTYINSKALRINYIHVKLRDVIIHPCLISTAVL